MVLEEFWFIFERDSEENYGHGEHVSGENFWRTHKLIQGFFVGKEHTQARSEGKMSQS